MDTFNKFRKYFQKKKIITKLYFPHSYSFQSQKRNNQTFLIDDINIR